MSRSPLEQTPQERFEALWNAHYADVFSYALRRLGDEQAASDVAAETFLTAWRRFDSAPEALRPWLFGVARKVLANQRRAHRRREALVARIASATERPSSAPNPDGTDVVTTAFDALSPSDREVLSLVTWEELTPREAAAVVGISAARFSVRLHRAKKRLRKELELAGHEGVEEPPQATRDPSLPSARMETE